MKKLIITGLLAALAIPTAANAVSSGDVRQDQQALLEEQRELERARQYGSPSAIRAEQRDVAHAREEYRDTRAAYSRQTSNRRYTIVRYQAPYGMYRHTAYQGQRLNRAFLASGYQIAQPWRYGLAAPYAGYTRWVHHGQDALLVDMRTGAIIAIARNHFW